MVWGKHCTLNSRVIGGSNPIVGSFYSFDRVFPGLGLLQRGCDLSHNLILLSYSRFTAQISSVHQVVLEMKSSCYVLQCGEPLG